MNGKRQLALLFLHLALRLRFPSAAFPMLRQYTRINPNALCLRIQLSHDPRQLPITAAAFRVVSVSSTVPTPPTFALSQ